jgi:hypothetical protein
MPLRLVADPSHVKSAPKCDEAVHLPEQIRILRRQALQERLIGYCRPGELHLIPSFIAHHSILPFTVHRCFSLCAARYLCTLEGVEKQCYNVVIELGYAVQACSSPRGRHVMSQDKLAKYRAKSRCAAELRYGRPLVQAFDKRGALLGKLNETFGEKMPHWRTENVAVHLIDNETAATREITVDHLRCLYIHEDPGTIQEFHDGAKRFIGMVQEVFPEIGDITSRLGVRFISVFQSPGCADFSAAYSKVRSVYLAEQVPLSLKVTDCQLVLQHETGRVSIGPVRKGEAWVRSLFSSPDAHMPDFGFGSDTDSYVVNPAIDAHLDVNAIFTAVYDQTCATEYEALAALGLGSKNG